MVGVPMGLFHSISEEEKQIWHQSFQPGREEEEGNEPGEDPIFKETA